MSQKMMGKSGMTKAAKKAARRAAMQGNRKRDKANQRAAYHSEFKRAHGRRGYPKKGPAPRDLNVGFITGDMFFTGKEGK